MLFVPFAQAFAEETDVYTEDEPVKYSIGDVDKDGEITSADARIILRLSVSLEKMTAFRKVISDIDRDNSITSEDARKVLRYSVMHVKTPIDTILYNTAHPLLGKSKPAFDNPVMKNFQKWCCYYTIHDVFQPVLREAGYTEEEINLFAPTRFPKETLKKVLNNITGIPPLFVIDVMDLYVPSLLADHYLKTPTAGETFIFYDYFDDIVDMKTMERTENADTYVPRVGDLVFMSNKERTYENGYPTIDHTAQIIKTYADGTFLCTEGSIIDPNEGDGLAKVRERYYRYDPETKTYEWTRNKKLICLMIARPNL